VPFVSAPGWAELSAARKGTRAAEAGVVAAEQRLEGALWKAAWLAEAAEGGVEAATRAHAAAEAQLARAQARVAAGAATRLDVLAAEADRALRAGELADARGRLDHAQRTVAALLGESEPIRIVMPDPLEIAREAVPGGDPAAALAARPDRDALDARIDAQRGQVTAADLRHLPTLTGTFAAFASDAAYVTGEKDGWRAGVELGWVLYDGGLRYGKRAQARAGLAAAEAARMGLDAQIRREVAEADRALALAGDRVAAAEAGRAAAAEAADFAARAYDAGTLDAYATTAAADRLFVADLALAQARAALGGAAVDVRLAAGVWPGTR
jgi:outer membrane protein TolC